MHSQRRIKISWASAWPTEARPDSTLLVCHFYNNHSSDLAVYCSFYEFDVYDEHDYTVNLTLLHAFD